MTENHDATLPEEETAGPPEGEPESSNGDDVVEPNQGWTRRDIWLALMSFSLGILILTYTVTAMVHDRPFAWWGLGWLLGPYALILGGNGLVRSLLAGRDGPPPKP